MNVGCRNGAFGGGDDHLVEPPNYVTGCVKTRNRGLLMGVDLEIALLVAGGRKRTRQIVTWAAAQRQINYVEIAAALRCGQRYIIFVNAKVLRLNPNPFKVAQARRVSGGRELWRASVQQCNLIGVRHQEFRLTFAEGVIADDSDAFIDRFKSIADGTDAQQAAHYGLGGAFDGGQVIPNAGRQQEKATTQRTVIRAEDKKVVMQGNARYVSPADPCAIFCGLFSQREKELRAADAGSKSGNVVARRYPACPRMTIVKDDASTAKSSQVNCRRQASRAATHDDGIVNLWLILRAQSLSFLRGAPRLGGASSDSTWRRTAESASRALWRSLSPSDFDADASASCGVERRSPGSFFRVE